MAKGVPAAPMRPEIPYSRLILSWTSLTDEVINHNYPGAGTSEDPYRVEWLENDPRNPLSLPFGRKWLITFIMAFATLAITFSSSGFSGANPQIMHDFDVSEEVAVVGVSLFVLAFAIGPAIWGPLSELCGRQIIFVITYVGVTLFSGVAIASKNITSVLVLRFFSGAFGASALTNAAGVIADMFTARERGLASVVFISAPFIGPTLGPIAGSFLGAAQGWKWLEGLITILTGISLILGVLLVPETYAPFLLQKRAAKLSKLHGAVYKSKLEIENGHKTTTQIFNTAMIRPWILLFREPIVLLLSLYMAIIYGTMYLEFAAFPIVFGEVRGWSQGVTGLSFIGVMIGQLLGMVYAVLDNGRYTKIVDRSPGKRAPAEARLGPSMVGAFALPIGLFWFAWTNYPNIHWIVSIIGTIPFGFSHVVVFLSVANYLIDSYTVYAASVLAANATIRALFGAAFPLFTTPMYHNLGIHWASSIPAFMAVLCMPFPFLFWKYGPRIRAACKYSADATRILEEMIAKSTKPAEEVQKEEPAIVNDNKGSFASSLQEPAQKEGNGDGVDLESGSSP
ncbi:Efflux pump FUBT [Lachnellula suecica]|uniref:Efflux pump FUBT n=1 Tax=Lachnellula suecica TaxID=602035 RepID=A0A8T9CC62_9HELO|nr:Efflux pump FUBT [Lachnellula suecica]